MASNSILKLQVDDRQYEASLKSAQQGLQALMNALRNSGKSFSDLDKNTEQYVRALGNMEATAKTTRGRIGEMSSAFVELSQVEKQLTDQERQSPVGKALTESLNQLKQRTIEAKQELADLDKQLSSQKAPATTDGIFSGIGSKMEGALAVFGGNMMTKASEAIVQLGSEMYGMVQQGIELAKQGEGIRIAFERLGRGDILDGLRQATHGTVTDLELMKAAVKFNDFKLPVSELGTMLAFAQQKAKDTGQSVDYMVDSIVTGLGRKSLMILDNLGLSANEIKEKMKQTGDMTKAVGAIIRDQMAKAGDYVETAADRAAQANVNLQNKMEELGRKFAPVEEASNQLWTSIKIGILDIVGGPLAKLLNGLTEAGRLQNMLNNLNGEGDNTKVGSQLKKLQAIKKAGGSSYMFNSTLSGMTEDYNRQIMALDAQIKNGGKPIGGGSGSSQDVRYLQRQMDALKIMRDELKKGAQGILNSNTQNTTTTTTTGGNKKDTKTEQTKQTELQKNQAKITELKQQFIDIYSTAAAAGKPLTKEQEKQTEEIQKQIELLKGRNELIGMWGELAEGKLTKNNVLSKTPVSLINPKEASEKTTDVAIPRGGLQLDDKAMRAVTKDIYKNSQKEQNKNLKKEQAIEGMGDLIGGVNNVFGGLQQMGIEIPQEISSVMGVLNGILTVVMGIESIITVGQFLGIFHNGGIVPHAANGYFVGGTHFSGDVTPIMANAGELVLSRSQQFNLASQLQGGGMQGLNLTATIKGEQIRLALNNNGRRTGRGEYVQSRNVR